MDVNNGLRRIDYLPMIAIRSDSPDMLLSERTHTMANNIQSVSNIAMPKVFSCALSMTYGALMATATYTGSKVITAFVYNLNDPLPLSESEYPAFILENPELEHVLWHNKRGCYRFIGSGGSQAMY